MLLKRMHINKNPPKLPGQSREIFVYFFFVGSSAPKGFPRQPTVMTCRVSHEARNPRQKNEPKVAQEQVSGRFPK